MQITFVIPSGIAAAAADKEEFQAFKNFILKGRFRRRIMSNECKDWIIENNKQLCSKFPFLKLDDEYNYTWLDSLESGWRTAFGDKICEGKILKGIIYPYYCNFHNEEEC